MGFCDPFGQDRPVAVSRLHGGLSGSPVLKVVQMNGHRIVVKLVGGHEWMLSPAQKGGWQEGPSYNAAVDAFQRMQEWLTTQDAHSRGLRDCLYIPKFFGYSHQQGCGDYLHPTEQGQHVLIMECIDGKINVADALRMRREQQALGHDDPPDILRLRDIRASMASAMGMLHRAAKAIAAAPPPGLLRLDSAHMLGKYLADLQHTLHHDNASLRARLGETHYRLLCDDVLSEDHGLPVVLRDRIVKIDALPKSTVHNDFQAKNLLIDARTREITVIDVDTAVEQTRLWDLVFLLIGSDEMHFATAVSPLESPDQLLEDWRSSVAHYARSCGPGGAFTTGGDGSEVHLAPNVLQIRMAHVMVHFMHRSNVREGAEGHEATRLFKLAIEVWVWVFRHKDQIRKILLEAPF